MKTEVITAGQDAAMTDSAKRMRAVNVGVFVDKAYWFWKVAKHINDPGLC